MNLYLKNAENIYFPQISEYFREVISSYDNGNYRSAIVMLYSTIVCDLILKLKELSEVYSDSKAESMLAEIDKQRAKAFDSSWEWKLIHSIRDRTELLSDEAFAMLQHIYDLRNFSAHPAMNEEYELISPTPEMTVAYIKQALDCVLTKPSVFAQNIVDRISDDIANRKDIFLNDLKVLNNYLEKVYFSRMSAKVKNQVFKAFWKFTFKKDEGEIFDSNRVINRKTLEILLSKHGQEICQYVRENAAFFTASNSSKCMKNLCVLLAYYPQVYDCLDDNTKHQTSLGKVISERVRRDTFLNPRPADVLGKVGFIGGYLHLPPRMPYREQVGRFAVAVSELKPSPQFPCCLLREVDCSLFPPLRLVSRQIEAAGFYVELPQLSRQRFSQAGSGVKHQHHHQHVAVLRVVRPVHALQEPHDLFVLQILLRRTLLGDVLHLPHG